MNKEKTKMIFMVICIGALCFGAGFMYGAVYTIQETLQSLDYVDNINIEVDLNETKIVEAMIPYIEEQVET